jgi:hypothetical protein
MFGIGLNRCGAIDAPELDNAIATGGEKRTLAAGRIEARDGGRVGAQRVHAAAAVVPRRCAFAPHHCRTIGAARMRAKTLLVARSLSPLLFVVERLYQRAIPLWHRQR